MGDERLRMTDWLSTGGVTVTFRIIDLRAYDVEELMATGRPGDYALAILASGGVERIREIVRRANRLHRPKRQRVLAQLAVLCGLRGASEQLTMEYGTMGISVELEKNVFLKEIHDAAMAKGRSEGLAEGRTEALVSLLHDGLETRFGKLPSWASARLAKATPEQAERWARKLLTAASLEGVLGRK